MRTGAIGGAVVPIPLTDNPEPTPPLAGGRIRHQIQLALGILKDSGRMAAIIAVAGAPRRPSNYRPNRRPRKLPWRRREAIRQL
jgi:hypothetical protein